MSSLKDPAAAEGLAALIAREPPDVILNTTAFSGRSGEGPGVLDGADAPVFQVMLSSGREEAWRATGRGLAAADLAMNVVLPEIDGRIVTRAISFKAESDRRDALRIHALVHRPLPSRVAAVADLAAAWVDLRRTPRCRAPHRLRALRLSGQGRAHGLCGRARHARQRRRHRGGPCRRGLRHRRRCRTPPT